MVDCQAFEEFMHDRAYEEADTRACTNYAVIHCVKFIMNSWDSLKMLKSKSKQIC